MKIISRSEAQSLGLTHYFTGKPCKHGHVDKRYVNGSKCFRCVKELNNLRREKDNEFKRNYYKSEKGRKAKSEYRRKNRDKINSRKRSLYHSKPEHYREQKRKDYAKHKVKRSKATSEYRVKHKDKLNQYYRDRRANDVEFKLSVYMRNMIGRIIQRGYTKDKPTCEVVGYDASELKQHIESLFVDGMNWDNYGEWHIDHVIPVSVWLDMEINDPALINALENLQPMWAKDNIAKGNKVL